MRRHILAALALTTLAATGSASASPPTPGDTPCSLTTITNPTDPANTLGGSLTGGPIAQTGTLTCTVQSASRHSDADVLSRSATGAVTTVLPPTTVSYVQTPDTQYYVCSSFSDGLGTYYFDNATGNWSTSGASLCVPVVTVDVSPLMGIGDFDPGFPPAGFAIASAGWVWTAGSGAPAFLPPQSAASHPPLWNCAAQVIGTTARATCTPRPGQEDPGFTGWRCYDPFVDVNIASQSGAAGDSLTGKSTCGTVSANCTATTSARGLASRCSEAAFPDAPVPLVCDADFAQAKPSATWAVRCSTIDP